MRLNIFNICGRLVDVGRVCGGDDPDVEIPLDVIVYEPRVELAVDNENVLHNTYVIGCPLKVNWEIDTKGERLEINRSESFVKLLNEDNYNYYSTADLQGSSGLTGSANIPTDSLPAGTYRLEFYVKPTKGNIAKALTSPRVRLENIEFELVSRSLNINPPDFGYLECMPHIIRHSLIRVKIGSRVESFSGQAVESDWADTNCFGACHRLDDTELRIVKNDSGDLGTNLYDDNTTRQQFYPDDPCQCYNGLNNYEGTNLGCYHPIEHNCNDAALAMLVICGCTDIELPPDCINSFDQFCSNLDLLSNRYARCNGYSYKAAKRLLCIWVAPCFEGYACDECKEFLIH